MAEQKQNLIGEENHKPIMFLFGDFYADKNCH